MNESDGAPVARTATALLENAFKYYQQVDHSQISLKQVLTLLVQRLSLIRLLTLYCAVQLVKVFPGFIYFTLPLANRQ